MRKYTGIWILFIGILPLISGCKIYSFTGANIPSYIKTVGIELFQNRASSGPASLPQEFTDKLKNKFQTEGNLRQANGEGDINLKGSITGYSVTSEAPVAGATSGLNKLTITVQVQFSNEHDLKDKWTETFSRFAEYSSSENFPSIEENLITTINTQLVDDIFEKALVKW